MRTVEQLASLSDTNAKNMMGLTLLRQRAQEFLEAVKDNAATEKLAHKLRERDQRIDGLEATIAEMAGVIDELKKAKNVPVSDGHSQPDSGGGGA